MNSPARIDTLAPWIELLCEAGDGPVQDRLLLECVLALGGARAVSLWRRERDGDGWRVDSSRGLVDLLPRRDEVEALAGGAIPAEALSQKRVIVAGDGLLALGGVRDDDEAHDLAASLFLTHMLMRGDVLDVDDIAAALPAGPLMQPSADAFEDALHGEPRDDARSDERNDARNETPGDTNSVSHAASHTTSRGAHAGDHARRAQHDVRNVLACLKATQDLLTNFSDGLSPEETKRFRAVVDQECERAGRMVAGALLGGSGHGASGTSCVAVDVLTQVLDAELAACERERVSLQRLIDPSTRGATLALSATDWSRLVHNLVVNARQAIAAQPTTRDRAPSPIGTAPSASGSIWVTLEPCVDARSRRGLRLTVEDDGPGIPPELWSRVLQDGFTSGKSGSSGQGLAIVRDFAERAGGTLRVENRASGGARIEVLLPVAAAPEGTGNVA